MSSGFVGGGSLEKPIGRDEAWLKAQEELEAHRKEKAEEAARQANDGKSLFDILQANKVAKQEAFEESLRLQNHVRSLDDDEVDFLDSVLESTRAKEAQIRKETAERLAVFRKHQDKAERAALDETIDNNAEESWVATGKKRKKGKENSIIKGVKLQKTLSLTESRDGPKKLSVPGKTIVDGSPQVDALQALSTNTKAPKSGRDSTQQTPVMVVGSSKASPILGLGLGNYSSDEDS